MSRLFCGNVSPAPADLYGRFRNPRMVICRIIMTQRQA
jgi:hypothetical protein